MKTFAHLFSVPSNNCKESGKRATINGMGVITKSNSAQNGFTLVELMIVVAIIAILASIALPSYGNYVKRSRAKSAAADLVALSLNFENYFQRTLNYPAAAASTTTTAATKSLMPGWAPSQEQFFSYSATTTTTTYEVKATGSGSMSGCDLAINNLNARTASSASACGGFSTW